MVVSNYCRSVCLGIAFLCLSGAGSVALSKENLEPSPETVAQAPVRKRISGTVTDGAGEPLVGVTFIEKGSTSNAGITDANGRYGISVPEGASISFVLVGYADAEILVAAGSSDVRNVSMSENVNALEEVVFVGYGTQKKVNLTGAVDVISEKELEDRPVANIAQAIQGKMPNVNITFSGGEPGLGGTINVRGLTSVNGGGPLVLIDGVPGDMNRINPNDVASISVLKDAAASAIYGARGAFGVILVTTKNARDGKISVTYNGFFAVSSPTVSTDFDTNGYRTTMLNDEAFRRTTGDTYTRYSEEDYAELYARRNDKTEHPDRPWVVVKNFNGKDIYNYYGNWDWWDAFYTDNQFSQSHNINASGGTDKLNFMLSGNYYSKDGVMKINTDKFHSFNFRSKVSAQLFPFLKITNNTSYYDKTYKYHGVRNAGNANFVNITVHALPAYAPFNPDGTSTFRTNKNSYSIGDGHQAVQADPGRVGEKRIHEFQTTTGLEFKPLDVLTINADYTYSNYIADNWYRATVTKYSVVPGVLEDVAGFNVDQYFKDMSFDPRHIANAYANYSDMYGKHSLEVTAGVNYESQSHAALSASRNNLMSETLNDIALGTGDMTVGGGSYNYTLLGAFFRVAYNFDEKYLFEVDGRYDGTSRYKKETRFGFFPSFSAAWRISEEGFFDGIRSTVSNAKIRASYGTLGNQLNSSSSSASFYPYISSLGMGLSNWLTNDARTQYVNAPSPIAMDLTWERATTTNIGLDLGFLNNRLLFTGDWYVRDTKGMLSPGPALPGVYGAASPQQNASDLRTKGYEITLRWQDQALVAGKPFAYEVFASLGDSKSKITKFNNPTKLLSQNYVGKEWGEIWGLKVDGFFDSDEEAKAWTIDQSNYDTSIDSALGEWQGQKGGDIKFVDVDGNGKITQGLNTLDDHGDFVKIGNNQPRYSYSFGTNLNWNGIDLSVFFQGVGRRDWYPGSNADKFWGPFSRPYYSFLPEDFESKLWSEDNKDSYFPVLRGYTALNGGGPLNVANDKYIQNIGYLRLKNLTVGYSLPERWMSKASIQNLRIYVSADNLFYWSPFETKYIDPEQPIGDGNGRTYPMSKTFSLGVDLTF